MPESLDAARRPPRRRARVAVAAVLSALLAAGVLAAAVDPARAGGTPSSQQRSTTTANVVTPGNFTGFGFDQCLAPEQWKMNRWLHHSPFLAVGVYMSGASRACRSQPNLDATWVSTQLRKGWRILPITLGPQASCQPRFPRYGNDVKINPKPGANGRFYLARQQGKAEAATSVAAAKDLGIVPGSTLWYDLEGYDNNNTSCRESALSFLSGWTVALHDLGYVSGVYSSAGSGILALDNARVNRPGEFSLPDQVWIARWDGNANTSTSYIREDGWRPHARVKQYQGGHDERWGEVRINIDRNFLDVGRGSVATPENHCNATKLAFFSYERLLPPDGDSVPPVSKVKALQCLLKEHGLYAGAISGTYSPRTIAAARTWQEQHGFRVQDKWSIRHWMSLLVAGDHPVLKRGSAGPAVRRLQRALNAADPTVHLAASGVFETTTDAALRAWQRAAGVEVSGVAAPQTWAALKAGIR
ncbi:glycoside hydrolase domain-containing protein [Nocardioides sp.]|uniref:glycoside hydrolase domain-containing protein n=1 Tax=Nocardioides sp. TaxID=35761 RepID=UPI0031FE53C5